MGREKHERVLLAGNQQGKTYSGSAELTYHLTGDYPTDWKGFRFERPIRAWAAGQTNQKTRDVVQLKLLGRRGRWGSGFLPKDTLDGDPVMSRGIAGLVDHVYIKHKAGGTSWLKFMSYEMDVDSWASDTLHAIWFDEEPPEKLYDEGLARLTATGGISFITFTPLHGMSPVVRRFYPRPNTPDRGYIRMGYNDAQHLKPAEKERILSRYAVHEREARAEGIPILGSGLVFTVPENEVEIQPFKIPDHWPRVIGLDLGGGDHPTAWIDLAWDRDVDTLYGVKCYKRRDPRISTHAASLRTYQSWIPVAWPHDASQHDRGTGFTYAEMYRQQGCTMLPVHAQFLDGSIGLEPGVAEMEERLSTGRLRIFTSCLDWFEEYRMYHREEGLIVADFDDLMSATRYGVVMRRYARKPRSRGSNYPSVVGMDYDPLAR